MEFCLLFTLAARKEVLYKSKYYSKQRIADVRVTWDHLRLSVFSWISAAKNITHFSLLVRARTPAVSTDSRAFNNLFTRMEALLAMDKNNLVNKLHTKIVGKVDVVISDNHQGQAALHHPDCIQQCGLSP